jgi:hypothetical protein
VAVRPVLKAPTSLRETVMLLGHMRPKRGLDDLFSQVDWSGVSRRQLIHAFLDRPPALGEETLEPPGFDARAAALELFASPGFRAGLAPRLLQVFQNKRRLLFVHVPKAAGTDYMSAMRRALPHVGNELAEPELVPADMLARRLARLGTTIKQSDTIFMGGHIPLAWFLDERIYRFGDRLTAILRHPREICVSLANYIVHRFGEDAQLSRPDTRSWAGQLGLGAEQIAAMEPQALALAVVARRGMQPINPICSLLGDGTARGTLVNLMRAPIEITSTAQYSAWLRHNWSLERDNRVNASRQVIGWDDLSQWQKDQIEAGCQEDYPVYEAAMACLARNGTLSVTGPEVARLAR